MMNVKTETIAFRIRQYCKPLEWNVTVTQIAEHLGISYQHVGAVLRVKNWQDRIRVVQRDKHYLDMNPHDFGFIE